ncbi:hypothetical protein TSOC_007856 [Tetrabaena socialis]|uniref:mRNA capping enzyme adenylation domain-containing protein n=1 Tax=Tetrabaena socialis TaxID=47790 RepID=A0A2J8A032_9CHLO|nr:hypothetical protein TSOC_007856 [Tetrabaena socialis]|eukprot:PNH05848.1 hypothetical protein TSOC_007856 [Tetrabaena socialis]
MHVGQISFCDGIGYNVKSDEDKERVSGELKAFGISVLARQYETMSKAIHRSPHLLSLRTHGNPYYLYLTKVNGVCQCIFVDKKIQQGYFQPRMILSKLWFDSSLFSGTVFDGEMVRCSAPADATTSWIFILNDLLVDRGQSMTNVNLVRRINRLYDILSTQFIADGMDLCQLQVKKYFPYGDLDRMLSEFMPSLPYSTPGIIFKSFLNMKFRDVLFDFRDDREIRQGQDRMRAKRMKLPASGFQVQVQKFQKSQKDDVEETTPKELRKGIKKEEVKKEEVKSFDVKKTQLPDVYELIDRSNNTKELACIPNIAISKDMRRLFASVGVADSIAMRCRLHDRFKRSWRSPSSGVSLLEVRTYAFLTSSGGELDRVASKDSSRMSWTFGETLHTTRRMSTTPRSEFTSAGNTWYGCFSRVHTMRSTPASSLTATSLSKQTCCEVAPSVS